MNVRRMGETMMSSLVFNTGVMLICSLAVTQFCTIAFREYARYTATLTMFGNQLQNFEGIHYVYDILIFAMPIISFLTMIYISVRPSDTRMKRVI